MTSEFLLTGFLLNPKYPCLWLKWTAKFSILGKVNRVKQWSGLHEKYSDIFWFRITKDWRKLTACLYSYWLSFSLDCVSDSWFLCENRDAAFFCSSNHICDLHPSTFLRSWKVIKSIKSFSRVNRRPFQSRAKCSLCCDMIIQHLDHLLILLIQLSDANTYLLKPLTRFYSLLQFACTSIRPDSRQIFTTWGSKCVPSKDRIWSSTFSSGQAAR